MVIAWVWSLFQVTIIVVAAAAAAAVVVVAAVVAAVVVAVFSWLAAFPQEDMLYTTYSWRVFLRRDYGFAGIPQLARAASQTKAAQATATTTCPTTSECSMCEKPKQRD